MTHNPFSVPRQPPLSLRLNTPRRSTFTAVLVTGSFGSLHLYTRRGPGPLRDVRVITHAPELADLLRQLPPPCVIVLCGTHYLSGVARCVLEHHDLYVVPTCWLRTIPASDPHGRATLAAQLVTAHRRRPIEHLVSPHNPCSLF